LQVDAREIIDVVPALIVDWTETLSTDGKYCLLGPYISRE